MTTYSVLPQNYCKMKPKTSLQCTMGQYISDWAMLFDFCPMCNDSNRINQKPTVDRKSNLQTQWHQVIGHTHRVFVWLDPDSTPVWLHFTWCSISLRMTTLSSRVASLLLVSAMSLMVTPMKTPITAIITQVTTSTVQARGPGLPWSPTPHDN